MVPYKASDPGEVKRERASAGGAGCRGRGGGDGLDAD